MRLLRGQRRADEFVEMPDARVNLGGGRLAQDGTGGLAEGSVEPCLALLGLDGLPALLGEELHDARREAERAGDERIRTFSSL